MLPLPSQVDSTGDGTVTADEIKTWAVANSGFMGDIGPFTDGAGIPAFIAIADTTNDGTLTLEVHSFALYAGVSFSLQ